MVANSDIKKKNTEHTIAARLNDDINYTCTYLLKHYQQFKFVDRNCTSTNGILYQLLAHFATDGLLVPSKLIRLALVAVGVMAGDDVIIASLSNLCRISTELTPVRQNVQISKQNTMKGKRKCTCILHMA